MPINEAALTALAARLARQDEAQRQRSLAQAEVELGPAPVAIEPSPRGTFPVMQEEAAPSRTATMMVPSRSTYDEMSDYEKKMSAASGAGRGMLATTLAGAALLPASGAAAYPSQYLRSHWPGPLAKITSDASFGAQLGGIGSLAVSAPFAGLSDVSDRMAGRLNPTSPTAGRFTPGARVQEELGRSYFPEQPWTRRMGISGEAVSPTSIEGAAERVEVARTQERAQEQFLIAQRQREMEEHQRRLAGARAQEAAREMALTRQFGTPTDRAENILALEALRMPEEYTSDYDNRYPLSSKAERASRGGATGQQASRNVQPPVPDPTRKAQADMFQSIDRGQGEEFIEQRKMEQLLRQLQEEEAMDRATEARLRLFRR